MEYVPGVHRHIVREGWTAALNVISTQVVLDQQERLLSAMLQSRVRQARGRASPCCSGGPAGARTACAASESDQSRTISAAETLCWQAVMVSMVEKWRMGCGIPATE